jgi:anti-anti-sigma factor
MQYTSILPASLAYLAKAPFGLECTWRDAGFDQVWVRLAGELDMATAALLEQTLRRAELRARMVVLDLRELTFMDSAGLHVIVEASDRARRAGRRLVLARRGSQFDGLFTTTGAVEVLDIRDLDPGEYGQAPAELPREAA